MTIKTNDPFCEQFAHILASMVSAKSRQPIVPRMIEPTDKPITKIARKVRLTRKSSARRHK